MKKSEIIERAKNASKNFETGDFFIGCAVSEVLPNKNKTTLVCVDCSWLRQWNPNQVIIDRNDLDEIIEDDKEVLPSITIDGSDIIFTKWLNMIDDDGDVHHCKIVTYCTLSTNIFNPIEDYEAGCLDYALYIEV